MKIKITKHDDGREILENIVSVTREKNGVLIVHENGTEMFIPYGSFSHYLLIK